MRVTRFLLVLLYGRARSVGERLDTHTHTHEESPINLKSLFMTVKGTCTPGLAPWLQCRRAGNDRFQLPGSISIVKLIFAAMIKQSLCYNLIFTETWRAPSPRKNGPERTDRLGGRIHPIKNNYTGWYEPVQLSWVTSMGWDVAQLCLVSGHSILAWVLTIIGKYPFFCQLDFSKLKNCKYDQHEMGLSWIGKGRRDNPHNGDAAPTSWIWQKNKTKQQQKTVYTVWLMCVSDEAKNNKQNFPLSLGALANAVNM